MRLALALVVLGAAASAAVAVVLPSCSDIPNRTCFGDRVHALFDDGGAQNAACTSCLQTTTECCDTVGECQDDPTKACPDEVKDTHRCLLEGGAAEEAVCKGKLKNASSKKVYSCMRRACADKCRVPSCDIDPSVILFASPSCDTCMGGACCSEINECYGNRRCKLTLECIINECPPTLGQSMGELADSGEQAIEATKNAVCAGGRPVTDAGISACVFKCINDFTSTEDGGTADDIDARCRAFSVYACGARHNCGPRCETPDAAAPSDAGITDANVPDARD